MSTHNGGVWHASAFSGDTPVHHAELQLSAPVLTGASGMAMISEMFQRQARRLESQQQLQAQLQWHASRYQERADQVSKSSETISRMQSYLGAMESERERAIETALLLARDVEAARQHVETTQPGKFDALSTTLSEMAMRVSFFL